MQYFDTDILIHYLVNQEPLKHQQARQLYQQAATNQTFFISLLSLQELTYALAKLQVANIDVEASAMNWHSTSLINYTAENFARAIELSRQIGFKHINDCLHTAFAEANNCSELLTYNRKEFSRIQPLTSLTITIL